MSFVHLHVHSEYSLLDGFSNIKKLVKRAKEMNMPAVGLTDHGTMFGVIDFYKAATEAGVKPIIGIESYMAARTMKERDSQLDKKSTHILLLAENQTGYQNLLHIASAAQLEGFYYFPRIDKDFLASHSEGLICTSGCMSAEIPRLIQAEKWDEAQKQLDWYYEVFGADRFFLELQQHDIPELANINKMLLDLGRRYQARFVATNDVHYVDKEDARLQDILLAIQTGCLLTDPNRMRMSSQTFYMRTADEMAALFASVPEALNNTLLIAERCNVDLGFKGYHLPEFEVPEGYTAESYLRELCEDGLLRRYGSRATDADVRQRLDFELSVIHKMGFDTYFLIVWDLCDHAREENIWFNARGSAAGSIVAYTLDITLVEPIQHGLIFERFLNPGRISMPDIDLDFRDDRRAEMLEYTARKYGDDKVAQIITFGTLGARAAIRDVGRVMDIPLTEVDKAAKMIPNIPGKPVTIREALEEVPEFKEVYKSADYMKELIDTASKMEGVVRNAGTHAAGVIITDKPIIEYIPLHRPTGNTGSDTPIKTVTQFEMSVVEALGLLKVDFLGLATLSIMAKACDLIRERHGVELTLQNIPTEDPDTYALLGRGDTAGVFQVEGSGMKRWLVQMKPKELANVIAMVALFRPGPMDFIPGYIKRMHGEEEVSYRHPMLEPIFKETYGYPVYQEQLMFAAMQLAGYTASEADDLRKAISKKMKDKLEKHREKFVKGSQKNGISEETAQAIFADWEEFARYGFNKCLPGSVEVLDAATGRLVRIDDLYTGQAGLDEILSCSTDTQSLRKSRVAAVMQNGVKPTYRLTTLTGRYIEATGNHPFYTSHGWQTLETLGPGKFIAVPRRIPVEGTLEWPDREVVSLAHHHAQIDAPEIPAAIFELNHRQAVLFIRKICEEGAGCFDPQDGGLAFYASTERMARQMQHLLLRFSILSDLRKDEYGCRCAVLVTEPESVVRFNQVMEAQPAVEHSLAGVTSGAFRSEGKFHEPAAPIKEDTGSDLYWDEIISIEYAGEQMTYDLEVPGDHNFIANDILVHNSHAADYGVISVQTAYLKCHYPVEYMTALLSVTKDETAKVALYSVDCRKMGIAVKPPDVNSCGWDFTIEDVQDGKSAIRFGLGAVKNVGQGAVEAILNARQDGPFININEFARRVDLRQVGKRALECLIKVGALDQFGNRPALLAAMDRVMSVSGSYFKAADSGQMSMFGAHTGLTEEIHLPNVTTEISRREILNWERELIGLYVSDHPLSPIMEDIDRVVTHFSGQLPEAAHNDYVRVAGVVTAVRAHQTKAGKPMGFATIEDLQGNIELVLFPRTWEKCSAILQPDTIVLVDGKVDAAGADPKILVDKVTTEFKVTTPLQSYSPADASQPTNRQVSRSVQQSNGNPDGNRPDGSQPVPGKPQAMNQPASRPPSVPKPAVREPEKADYLPPEPDDGDETLPPPPDNFPAEYDFSMVAPIPEVLIHAMDAVPAPLEDEPEPLVETLLAQVQISEPEAPVNTFVEEPALPAEPPAPVTAAPLPVAIYPSLLEPLQDTPAGDEPLLPPYILNPMNRPDGETLHMITIVLRSTGDKTRDVLRMRRVHGEASRFPGNDRLSLWMFERGKGYLVEFPNFTTGWCPELVKRLGKLVGSENVRVEPITFQ